MPASTRYCSSSRIRYPRQAVRLLGTSSTVRYGSCVEPRGPRSVVACLAGPVVRLPTTKDRRNPFHVSVGANESGLREPCLAKVEDLRSVSRHPLVRRPGRVSTASTAAVEERVRIILFCNQAPCSKLTASTWAGVRGALSRARTSHCDATMGAMKPNAAPESPARRCSLLAVYLFGSRVTYGAAVLVGEVVAGEGLNIEVGFIMRPGAPPRAAPEGDASGRARGLLRAAPRRSRAPRQGDALFQPKAVSGLRVAAPTARRPTSKSSRSRAARPTWCRTCARTRST